MPIKPTSSETHDEFISRCMSEENSSFPDEAQRYAVCESKWSEGRMSMSNEQKVAGKIARLNKYKGINLTSLAEGGLEDACWAGYEAIGTKILDGR